MKNTTLKLFRLIPVMTLLLLVGFTRCWATINKVKIYSCPDNKMLSNAYRVSVGAKPVPVYAAKVGAADDRRRFLAVDDLMHSADYYDMAAFAYFDLSGKATVTVFIDQPVKTAKVLPTSAGIKPLIHKNSISFTVTPSKNLTIEINGEWVKSLHIFANPIETNIPKPTDPNVIYFGPGIHEVSSLVVGDNKTVYIAGGAVVRAVVRKNERYDVEPSGLHNYSPTFELHGRNVRFLGHGIIDGSALPTHARNFVTLIGSKISLEGVIIVNSSGWTVPVRSSDSVNITNIKLIGYRANSDGIDICNSRHVTVDNCFIRTNDDLVVVKTWENQGQAKHIVVKNCVLWNQLAHALSIGPELRENVDEVLFSNCDIIHDQGREWSLRVFHSDASRISNIRFENIRIEESHQLLSLWIGKIGPPLDKNLGTIENVTFKNIKASGAPLAVQLIGGDDRHPIKNIVIENVRLNGKLLTKNMMQVNPFVKNLSIKNL